MDQVGDNFGDAFVISGNGEQVFSRAINTGDDRDVYSIALFAGQTIEIILEDTGEGSALGFGIVEVVDSTNNQLDIEENLVPGDTGQIVFEAPATGTYYIVVTGDQFFAPGLGIGTYTLRVRPSTTLEDPEGDTPALALALDGFGTTTHEILNIDDEDFFTLNAQPGERVRAFLDGTGADPLDIGVLAAFKPNFDLIKSGVYSNGEGTQIDFTMPASGTVLLAVGGLDQTEATDIGTYQLAVAPDVRSDIDLAVSVTLVNEPGDNGRGQLDLQLRNPGTTVLDNVNFSIVLTTDEVIDASDIGLLFEGPITLAAEGQFSSSVPVSLPDDLPVGTYRFAAIIDPDNVVAEDNETNNIAFTQSFLVEEPRFVDLAFVDESFRVFGPDGAPLGDRALVQGLEYSLSIDVTNLGSAASQSTAVDLEVSFPGAQVTNLGSFFLDSMAPGAVQTFTASFRAPESPFLTTGTATATAIVFRVLNDVDTSNNQATPLSINVVNILDDDHGDDLASATRIAVGERVTGVVATEQRIAPDIDVFAFDPPLAARYQFTLAPDASLTAPVETPRAVLIDPNGIRTAFTGTEGQPLEISGFTSVPGTYRIEIAGSGLPGAGYALSFDSIVQDQPDDHSDVAIGATPLGFGTPVAGVIDARDDQDVFSIDAQEPGFATLRVTRTDGGAGVTVEFSQATFNTLGPPVFAGSTIASVFEKIIPIGFSTLSSVSDTVTVSGVQGSYEVELIEFGSNDPVVRSDINLSSSRDLSGALDAPDIFLMDDNSTRSLIRNFEFGLDRIDVSQLGAEELGDLTIANQLNRVGNVTWVNITDPAGHLEIGIRFGDGTPLDAAAFTSGDFIFAPPTARTAGVVQQDTAGFDDFRGQAGPELYTLLDDGVRDLIRAFEFGLDKINVSAFAESLDDLTITNQTRGDGSVNWVNIADFRGEIELGLRFGDSTPLDASAFSADDFIFSDEPLKRDQTFQDLPGFTQLAGEDTRDTFIMLDDGARDLIRGFNPDEDVIDVSAFAESLADLTIANQTRSKGSVNWVNISDFDGEQEMALRFDGGALDAARLSADNFIFSEEPIERQPQINTLTDTDGFSDLRATTGRDLFVMQDDAVRDIIRGFQPGFDQIDLTDYGAGVSANNIFTQNLVRRDGSVNWVEVFVDRSGQGISPGDEADFIVRFDRGTVLDASSFGVDDFVF